MAARKAKKPAKPKPTQAQWIAIIALQLGITHKPTEGKISAGICTLKDQRDHLHRLLSAVVQRRVHVGCSEQPSVFWDSVKAALEACR